MKIISWNVNGLRSRMQQVLMLLGEENPDIVLIQEIKWASSNDSDPTYQEFRMKLGELGYNCYSGSISSNHGVMTIYRTADENMISLIDSSELPRDRVLVIAYGELLILNVYINQGQHMESPEYSAKLNLFKDISMYLCKFRFADIVIGGDFNVCPEDSHVWSTTHWNSDTISRTPAEIAALKNLCEDFELENSDELADNGSNFTWYGYRQWYRKLDPQGVFKDDGKYGIKPDHIVSNIPFLSHKTLIGYRLLDSPSDHVPLEATIAIAT